MKEMLKSCIVIPALACVQLLSGATFELDCRSADAIRFESKLSVGDKLALALPDDERFDIELVETSPSKIGGETFLGKVGGANGLLTATVVKGKRGLKINFTSPTGGFNYDVRAGARGTRVRKVNPADFIRTPSPSRVPARKNSPVRKQMSVRREQNANPVTVDVLVAYDNGAGDWLASEDEDAETFAESAVGRMNAALANTGLNSSFRFRLVGVCPVDARSANFNAVLDAVTEGRGAWESVSSMRDEVGADIVTTLIDTGSAYGTTGLGWSLQDDDNSGDYSCFSESAYNVCAVRSVAVSHTMTHEVGHNMGAGHSDRQSVQPGPQLFSYSSGYYFTANGNNYHTIMAYDSDGRSAVSYSEVPYFSSPLHSYEGTAVGDDSHDNTRTLKNTFEQVAAFREARDEPVVDPDPEPVALTWHTTKAEAFAAAESSGRRILLVYGRDTCGNTTATRDYTCEDAAVKAKLLEGYVLWYSNCDTQSSESSRYLVNFEGTLPGVSVIDPASDTAIAGAGGYLNVSAMLSLLEGAENWESPEPQRTLEEARVEALETGKLLFVLSGADWCPYTTIVKDYIRSLGPAFTDDFVLYYCDVDTDTTGMADGIPSYGAFDPAQFAGNWRDGLLAYASGGVDERVQKVLDDALTAYRRAPEESLTWYTTKAEAFAAAESSGRRILLVFGRDTCGNTTATRDSTCEDTAVKAKLLEGYVLWYSNCDTQSSESGKYLMNFEGLLPGVSVIDPAMDEAIAGAGGYQSVSAMLALLEAAEAARTDDPPGNENVSLADPKLKGADLKPVETPVAALAYSGYATNGEEVVGLVTVKVTTKGDVTATVQLSEGMKLAKTSYKGTLGKGGKAKLACSKNGGEMSVLVCEGLVSGTIEVGKGKLGFTARSGAKVVLADLDGFNGKVWTVALKTASAKGLPKLMNGYSVLSVAGGKKGKMKVSGVLADGTKVSVTAQGMAFGDSVVVPVVYRKKTTAFSLKLILKEKGGVQVGNVSAWTSGSGKAVWEKAIASASDKVRAGVKFALGTDVKDIIEAFGVVDVAKGKKSILPNGVPVKAVDASSGKWTLPKAGKVALVKGTTDLDETKFTAKGETDPNPAGLKLTFKKKTGLFSGSFQLYQLNGTKLKKLKATVNGAVVDGVGYGSAVIKNTGAMPVTVGK